MTQLKLDDVENMFMRERWKEVIQHSIVVVAADPDPELGDHLILTLDQEDAKTWGIAPVLSIDQGGRVAELMDVPVLYHYQTFTALLTAAAARQSVT